MSVAREERAGAKRAPASRKETLRFFYSPTSGPSRRAEAFLANVLQRRQRHRVFALQRINCDEQADVAERFAVKKVPTLVVGDPLDGGGRLEGSFGCRDIERLLDSRLEGRQDREPAEEAPSCRPSRAAAGAPRQTRLGLGLPEGLPFERWRALGLRLGGVVNASLWWLGDWSAHGEASYGDRYDEVVALTGLDCHTLRNYAWVARRFDVDRRREGLSFAHHAEVAALDPAEQDAWLDLAAEHDWSRNELRSRLRGEVRGVSGDLPASRVEYVRLGLDVPRAERWRKAAHASGLEVSEWLVAIADAAARARLDARAAALL